MRINDYAVIDIETTGFSRTNDRITELAALIVKDGRIADSYNTLINPQRSIPYRITRLTGISNAMTADCPVIAEAMPEFLEALGGNIIVGHNVKFDLGFIAQNGLKGQVRYVDTMELSRACLPQLSHHKLSDICAALGVVNDRAHRALSDCMATHECLQRLMDISEGTLNVKCMTY